MMKLKNFIIYSIIYFLCATYNLYSRSVPYEYKGRIIKLTKSISFKPNPVEGVYLIWDFNEGLQNRLGGWGNPFVSGDCEVEVDYSSRIKRGRNGRSLQLIGKKKANCYCGFWFHLFDMKAPEKKYIDITDYGYLSFFVKGEQGGEDFLIKVADEEWVKREDAVIVGPVSDYIEGGNVSSEEWREVVLPVADFKIDITKFAGVTFEFLQVGKTVVYIDDVTLKDTRDRKVKLYGDEFVGKTKAVTKSIKRAMWVWHPEDYQDLEKMKELIKFCKEKSIDVLWCQALIKYYKRTEKGLEDVTDEEIEREGKNLKIVAKFVNPEADRRFLEYAHKNGIKEIHLLDGYKFYVLEMFHSKMLAEVEAVIRFNQEAENEYQRWDGVHHDNEPYLLDQYKNPSMRPKIFVQYLSLAEKIKNLISLYNSDLKYGVDIPFWFDESEEAIVKYKGKEKPVSFHLLEIVDNVGIMDYRNFAYGPDGTIAHGKDEVEYATKVRKKVYIGVETIEIEPKKITFYGKTEEYMNKVLGQTIDYFKSFDGFAGIAIHYYRSYREICENSSKE